MADDIKDLALKFAEKNPTLLRDMMESFHIRFEELEFSEGRQTKGKSVKSYKNIKP